MSIATPRLTGRHRSELQIRDIDCAGEWNQIVAHLGGHLRQGWEWGELGGHTVHRRAILAGDRAVAAVAMTEIAVPGLPGRALYASRGPVIAAATPRVWPAVVEAIRETASRCRAAFVRLSPAVAADDPDFVAGLRQQGALALPDQWSLWNAPRVVMQLDLRHTEADVKRRMRESTRLSLGRATSRGVTLERLTDAEAVVRFHRLLAGTGRRRGYPVRRLEYFEALRQRYLGSGAGVVVMASLEGRDIAGVLGVRFGQVGYLLYAALDPEFRQIRAGVAVHWEFIRWAREQGCETMDWGGAVTSYPPTPTDPGYGIYDFKRGFGGDVGLLSPYFDIVRQNLVYRMFRLAERHAGWLAILRSRFN